LYLKDEQTKVVFCGGCESSWRDRRCEGAEGTVPERADPKIINNITIRLSIFQGKIRGLWKSGDARSKAYPAGRKNYVARGGLSHSRIAFIFEGGFVKKNRKGTGKLLHGKGL
jgi:hypothetical protein